MAVIHVKNLKYRYPTSETLNLNSLNFSIESGEFIGIIGGNNAGKSTLCQAISGLVPHFYKGAYGGEIRLDNLVIKDATLDEIAQKVGIVFQNPFNQITGSKLTVYEEIAFGLENMGLNHDEMNRRILEVLQILKIEHLRDKNPFSLSGGQMQRLAIASILAMKPEILILDEPTSQLDPKGTQEVFDAVDLLRAQGITIIMVEHKMEKLVSYCDRIMLMHEGAIVAFDRPSVIFSRADISRYGIEAPVYTQVSQALAVKKNTDEYPVTLEEAVRVIKEEFTC